MFPTIWYVMTARPLTAAETSLARSLFGDAIDYDRVRVRRARWWPFQPRDTVMAPDGDIWCHPAGQSWRTCFAGAGLAMRALFIHEMTHVWQAQRGGRWYLPLIRHPFCRYRYRLVPGKPFARYGIEQQAEIAADVFRLRQGAVLPGRPPLAAYEHILPFRSPGHDGMRN